MPVPPQNNKKKEIARLDSSLANTETRFACT